MTKEYQTEPTNERLEEICSSLAEIGLSADYSKSTSEESLEIRSLRGSIYLRACDKGQGPILKADLLTKRDYFFIWTVYRHPDGKERYAVRNFDNQPAAIKFMEEMQQKHGGAMQGKHEERWTREIQHDEIVYLGWEWEIDRQEVFH